MSDSTTSKPQGGIEQLQAVIQKISNKDSPQKAKDSAKEQAVSGRPGTGVDSKTSKTTAQKSQAMRQGLKPTSAQGGGTRVGSKRKPQVRYEIKIELLQMNFEISDTSVFKLQLNEPQQFLINSKKYRIEADDDEAITQGVIDFENDHFNRVASFALDPETHKPIKKIVFLNVLQNGNSIYQHELCLNDYISNFSAVQVSLTKGKEIPEDNNILGLTFSIELVQVLDDDNQSHQQLKIMQQIQKQAQEEKTAVQKQAQGSQKAEEKTEQSNGKQLIDIPAEGYSNEAQKLRDELAALTDQNQIQNLLKLKLQQDYEEAKAESAGKDAIINKLKDQIKSLIAAKENEQSEHSEMLKIFTQKDEECEQLKSQLQDQVGLKNQVFQLESQISELQKQIQEKDKERMEGVMRGIEEAATVKALKSEVKGLERTNQKLENELSLTKHLLKEQQHKFAEKEQDTKHLKRDNRILEQFVRIETKSPRQMVNDLINGDDQKNQENDKYGNELGQSLSPYPQSHLNRFNDQLDLDLDANIF